MQKVNESYLTSGRFLEKILWEKYGINDHILRTRFKVPKWVCRRIFDDKKSLNLQCARMLGEALEVSPLSLLNLENTLRKFNESLAQNKVDQALRDYMYDLIMQDSLASIQEFLEES